MTRLKLTYDSKGWAVWPDIPLVVVREKRPRDPSHVEVSDPACEIRGGENLADLACLVLGDRVVDGIHDKMEAFEQVIEVETAKTTP